MVAPTISRFPFSSPTSEECAALAVAARYLLRAGTEAATRLLDRSAVDTEAALLAAVSDSLFQGAALCDGMAQNEAVVRERR